MTIAAADSDGANGVYVDPAFRPFFWLFASVSVVLFYYATGYARKYYTMAAFLLPPFICASITFDNIIMATIGIDRNKSSVRAMLAFHSCVIPMILLVCYEIAYLVHKQKSVNFCGISFESGHRRVLGRNALSTCLRFSVWMIGLALLVMNLLVSYRWSDERVEMKSIYDLEGTSTTHAVFSVAPALVLVILSLYIGLQLWNYGTFYSYMVHATCFNPWIWMLVGSVSLLAGYVMPTEIYALTSNAGELIMVATIIRMFREVHHDMQQGQQMRNFIDPIPTVSPQSMSRSGGGLLLDSKYSPLGASHNSATGALGSSSATTAYLEVLTPKESSEVRLTAAHHHHTSESALSVVVTSSRTNPLFN